LPDSVLRTGTLNTSVKDLKKQFEYKEIDYEGHLTLDVISEADNFNRWIYDTIKPYCKGNVLEIGSGVGNISRFFVDDEKKIFLSDIRSAYCDMLRRKFSQKSNVLGVENIDLVNKKFDSLYAGQLGRFDTVFALNVIEHIEDDNLAIINCKKFLAKGGNLVVLVPAYQWLYNHFDRGLYHYRRYVKKQMCDLFQANDLTVKRSFYFNALGIAGWFVSAKFTNKPYIPKSQMIFYNRIIPFAKLLDNVVLSKIGLSVIVVGEKK
jgi:2-polyprenyl-3-methyl-5-hydroxy-6-metoxy-1,4-benzoquinol methylase